MSEKLTLIIPTKDRSDFLRRALRYYSQVSCQFTLLICDSSNDAELERNISTIAEYKESLKINHLFSSSNKRNTRSSSGWQDDELLSGVMDNVVTPYVAFFADDDFAIVKNISIGIDFLETNNDYSYVCGTALILTLSDDAVVGNLESVGLYSQRGVCLYSAKDRLTNLLSNYSVLEYGVSRTKQMRYRWRNVFDAKIDNLSAELLNCSLVAIQGKAKKLNELLLVRQGHNRMNSRTGRDAFDWISEVFFKKSYGILHGILAKELAAKENIDVREASEIVKQAFWAHIAKGLNRRYEHQYGKKNVIKLIREFLRTVPWVKRLVNIVRGIKAVMLARKGELSLPALLNTSSPYHKDFMPVYKVVTSFEENLAKER